MNAAKDVGVFIKAIASIDAAKGSSLEGAKGRHSGLMAEFVLLTCLRLKSFYDDSIADVFMRSALPIEDDMNRASRDISSDIVVQSLSHNQNARFIQSKSSASSRQYDPRVDMFIVDAKSIRGNVDQLISLLSEFVDVADYTKQVAVMEKISRIVGFERRRGRDTYNPDVETLTQAHIGRL